MMSSSCGIARLATQASTSCVAAVKAAAVGPTPLPLEASSDADLVSSIPVPADIPLNSFAPCSFDPCEADGSIGLPSSAGNAIKSEVRKADTMPGRLESIMAPCKGLHTYACIRSEVLEQKIKDEGSVIL